MGGRTPRQVAVHRDSPAIVDRDATPALPRGARTLAATLLPEGARPLAASRARPIRTGRADAPPPAPSDGDHVDVRLIGSEGPLRVASEESRRPDGRPLDTAPPSSP